MDFNKMLREAQKMQKKLKEEQEAPVDTKLKASKLTKISSTLKIVPCLKMLL